MLELRFYGPAWARKERIDMKIYVDSPRCLIGDEVGNAQSLADRIDYWIEHEEEKRQLSGEYIAYAERFRLEHSIDLMEQMFREAVQEERA